jgi:hypothetical protein
MTKSVQSYITLNQRLIAGVINNKYSNDYQKIYVVDRLDNKTSILPQAGVSDIVSISNNKFMSVSLNVIDTYKPPSSLTAKQSLEFLNDAGIRDYIAPFRAAIPDVTIASEAQIWDADTLQITRKHILFPQDLQIHSFEALKVFSDEYHVAGIVRYWSSNKDEKLQHDEESSVVKNGVFILDTRDGRVEMLPALSGISNLKNLTVLSDNQLAVVTLSSGIYVYQLDFTKQPSLWAALLEHVKPDTSRAINLLGLLESDDGQYWVTYHSTHELMIWDVFQNEVKSRIDDVNVDALCAPQLTDDNQVVWYNKQGLLKSMALDVPELTFSLSLFAHVDEKAVQSQRISVELDKKITDLSYQLQVEIAKLRHDVKSVKEKSSEIRKQIVLKTRKKDALLLLRNAIYKKPYRSLKQCVEVALLSYKKPLADNDARVEKIFHEVLQYQEKESEKPVVTLYSKPSLKMNTQYFS